MDITDEELAQQVRDLVKSMNAFLDEANDRGITANIQTELIQKPGKKPSNNLGITLTKSVRLL